MRNHLHGAAQKITATFTGDQALIDGTGRKVGIAGQVLVNKALVVAQVQIGLVAVLGHKDLAMLERTHGAGVDVQIRVGLLHRYLVAARLEQTAQRGRGNTLAQRRNHAAGHEHMLGHIELPALPVEVVHTHLTGLHCNTRDARRTQFSYAQSHFSISKQNAVRLLRRRRFPYECALLSIGDFVLDQVLHEHTGTDAL